MSCWKRVRTLERLAFLALSLPPGSGSTTSSYGALTPWNPSSLDRSIGVSPSSPHIRVPVSSWTYFATQDPIEAILPIPDDIPLTTHWSMAQCVNIRDIDVAVQPEGPGALAQEIITSAPIAKLRSICLILDCKVKADLASQVDLGAWEALESHLCYIADQKLKKDPPEKFVVTLFFTPSAKRHIRKGGGEVRLGKFLDGLQKRGVLKVKVP